MNPSSRADLYLTHQDLIEKILHFTTRRHRCSADEAEDFAAWARLRLIENDYAILSEFEGRSGMSSYLAVVVQRLFLDYRISKWGKWRPSAEAKRLGPLAVRLETLIARDGLSQEEAYQTLRNAEPGLRRGVVDDLLARLPARGGRRFEGEGTLEALQSAEPAPEEAALLSEAAAIKRKAGAALMAAMREMEPQDQLVLRLRFGEGMQIADVARTLHLEARPLYRRVERLVAELRRALAERGVRAEDFGWPGGGGAVFPQGKQGDRSRLKGEWRGSP